MPTSPPLQPRGATMLIRTSFEDGRGWTTLYDGITTPTAEGFLATVDVVDDLAYSAASPNELRELLPEDYEGPYFFFVADRTATEEAGHPILVVPVPYPAPELSWLNDPPRAEFRVEAAHLWSVENNLSLANMDWRDFADNAQGGVFRGF